MGGIDAVFNDFVFVLDTVFGVFNRDATLI